MTEVLAATQERSIIVYDTAKNIYIHTHIEYWYYKCMCHEFKDVLWSRCYRNFIDWMVRWQDRWDHWVEWLENSITFFIEKFVHIETSLFFSTSAHMSNTIYIVAYPNEFTNALCSCNYFRNVLSNEWLVVTPQQTTAH